MESLLTTRCIQGETCSRIYKLILQEPPFTRKINERIIEYMLQRQTAIYTRYTIDCWWNHRNHDIDLAVNAICKILHTGNVGIKYVIEIIEAFIKSDIDPKHIIAFCKLYSCFPNILVDNCDKSLISIENRIHIVENTIEYIKNETIIKYLQNEYFVDNIEINKLISQMIIKNDEIQPLITKSTLINLVKFLPYTKDIVSVFLYSLELDNDIIDTAYKFASAEGLDYIIKTTPTKENFIMVLESQLYEPYYRGWRCSDGYNNNKLKVLIDKGYKLDIESINIALERSIEISWDIVVNAGLDKDIGIEQFKICESKNFLPKLYNFNMVSDCELLEVICNKKNLKEVLKFLKTHRGTPSYKSIENACNLKNNYKTIKALTDHGGKLTFNHLITYSKTVSYDMQELLLLYQELETERPEKVILNIPINPNPIPKNKSHEVPEKVKICFGERVRYKKITFLTLKKKILQYMKAFLCPQYYKIPYEFLEVLEIPNEGEGKEYIMDIDDIDKFVELFYL